MNVINREDVRKQVVNMLADLKDLAALYMENNRKVAEMGYTKSKVDGIEKKTLRKLRTPRACWRYKEYHNQYLTPYPIMHIGIDSFQRTGYSEVERAVLGWD